MNVQGLKSRKVLKDDRRGEQIIQVEQEAIWKFLCFSGTFTTKLLVNQNRRSGVVGCPETVKFEDSMPEKV